MTTETHASKFQRAKDQALRVRIVTHKTTFGSARVVDVDGGDVYLMSGERDHHLVRLGDVVSVEVL